VALFEASKGLIILLAGFGLLALIHADVQAFAETLVQEFHLNPARRYPKIFLDLAGHVTDQKLWMFAILAFLYATLRFIEAFGLWFQKAWAEWLAALSGGLYIPFELRELFLGINSLKVVALVVNLVIVGYMTFVLVQRYRNSVLRSP
jgi:uncharacterized membrane protein (DUF2068 family)